MTARRFALLLAVTIVVLLLAVSIGSVRLGPAELVAAFRGGDATTRTIIWDLRVPRVLLAFVVGGGLGVTGAALQALVRNPLADPYLLGLSGGAGLGAVAAIALGAQSPWAVPIAAFAGALAAVALVYRLAVVAGRRLDPHVLLLAGVVVGAFAGAIMSAIIVLSDAPQLRNAIVWLLGGLGGASWPALMTLTLWSIVPLAIIWVSARSLDLLSLGEETAAHLGADPERLKRIIYLSASLLTAASVATCGIIGFVGLVIPHAVRRAWTPLHRVLVPASFLAGGTFLVIADALARTVLRPVELPVGVITALVGVPFFALLLRRTVAS
jgi:iron complex transport system permease protein